MPLTVSFAAGRSGPWRIDSSHDLRGAGLTAARRLTVMENGEPAAAESEWVLRGVVSNTRYTSKSEATTLASRQEELRRPQATRAALIPISKTPAWWALAQDERRQILERSRHIEIGLEALPAVARRLHHGRDLGEPFDFLTWFEFAPEHADLFESMLGRLRASEEWGYVEREVDVRLSRDTM